ncbi:MAG: F0F1 ATP synthase subunit B [Lachnospiraceae bacterium]
MLKIDWNLLFTIINLVILYALMRKFLYKPVMSIMEKRQEMIDNQFKSAKEAEDKANLLRDKWEESMAGIEAEKSRILDSANERAKAEYEEIIANANNQASYIIDNANKKIAADKEKTLREIEGQIAGIAMLAAAKIVNDKSRELDNSPIYDEFLAGSGKSEKN